LDAYLRAVEAEGDEARRADMTAHARAIRSHVQHLSSKAYAAQIGPSADMVVLFLPGEAFFMAAIEHDRTLIEDALKHSVLLSTPIMLIALLKTIAHSWREQQVADNARRIADEGRAFLNRLCIFAEHLNNVGDGLGKATKAYNRAVGSWQAGVIPGASSLRELGVQSGREDSLNVSTVDEAVRSVVHADAVDDALLLAPADAPSPVREHIIEVPDKGE
jgi:DNA recombination protein RmuC